MIKKESCVYWLLRIQHFFVILSSVEMGSFRFGWRLMAIKSLGSFQSLFGCHASHGALSRQWGQVSPNASHSGLNDYPPSAYVDTSYTGYLQDLPRCDQGQVQEEQPQLHILAVPQLQGVLWQDCPQGKYNLGQFKHQAGKVRHAALGFFRQRKNIWTNYQRCLSAFWSWVQGKFYVIKNCG